MDGLIIKPKWVDMILSGAKTLEIRGTPCKGHLYRPLYILESGTQLVRGTIMFLSCTAITTAKQWHCIRSAAGLGGTSFKELLSVYSSPYAWNISYAHAVPHSIYRHPKGAVVWVRNVDELFADVEGGEA